MQKILRICEVVLVGVILVGIYPLVARAGELMPGKVMLDAWFNSQQRKNAAGQMEYFHYKWEDTTYSGFSLLAGLFRDNVFVPDTLYTAPTLKALQGAQIYIIVSPDIPAKNPNPHYMRRQDARQVVEWVKQGGVLVLMENDPGTADIKHMDLLADSFGIHFNPVLAHHVVDKDIAPGTIAVQPGGPLFHHAHTLYMKDTCTISIKRPAMALLRDKEGIVMATAKYGKGTVFAVVDPWLYNEYSDGRKLPVQYDNLAGGKELVRWLSAQVHDKILAIRRD